MAFVLIVIILALLQYIGFSFAVGYARGKYQVAAPAISGHPIFERYFRVHMNTLEQLICFLPAIWLFAQFVDPRWAAALGVVYLTGRMIYFFSYVKEPKSRGLGFMLTSTPTLIMLFGVLWEAVKLLRIG